MSIELMISEHPLVGAGYNATLSHAVRQAIDCAAICTSCADICAATAKIAMRRTGTNRLLIRSQLAVCIEACDTCAEECARHKMAHRARCAQMCKECAQACRTAIEGLDAEIGAEF